MSRVLEFKIDDEFDGKKVLQFLRGHLKMSTRLIAKLKTYGGGLTLNGEHIRTIDRLQKGDILRILMPKEPDMLIFPLPVSLDVVYEDEDIIVINKPSGLAMHTSRNNQTKTLANAFTYYFSQKGRSHVFRAVGRLDKGTSGLVVCALNKYAASRLSANIKKTYMAIPKGYYEGCGTINEPIYRSDPAKTLRWVSPEGEYAITHWQALKSCNDYSLLEVKIETGRTHQIRVHFAYLGTPLLGDDMYGGDISLIDRPSLHCYSLEFCHPISGKTLFFKADMPKDMKALADKI